MASAAERARRARCATPEKRAYVSSEAAVQGAIETDPADLGLHPYRCGCGAWHVGHRRKLGSAWAKRLRAQANGGGSR